MKTIWKYEIEITDVQKLSMPKGYKILSVCVKNNIPCMWAIVDPQEEREEVSILVRGTGHTLDGQEGNFIGTILLLDDKFVFHVFKRSINA